MPLYQQIILGLPRASSEALALMCRNIAKTILVNKGNVRGVENHGVKPLAQRTRRKYAVADGTRYFWEARYISITFDGSPKVLTELERTMRNESAQIRHTVVKMDSGLTRSTTNMYRNPYWKETQVEKLA